MPGASADFDHGRRVGKYEILTRLSVGGMAELFLAYTSGPGGFRKFVAVKQILPDVKKDPAFVKMFLDEARITAALSHANVAQVFDLGQEDGELYLAMEFISGQNLERVVKVAGKQEKSIPLGLAARVVRDTCLGLHCAHNFVDPSGKPFPIIHRDVSPKNVMITYAGDVKVIDFGIAKAKGRLNRTQVGIVKGTSGYMSPEQVRGEPLDGRSDLFAAGVMLYELLGAQRLYSGSNDAEMMLKIAEDEVPDVLAVNPDVPAPLAEVVSRSLQKSRDDRFATGKEMAKAIDAALGAQVFDEEQAAEVMRSLFEDRMKTTQQLLETASKSDDVVKLDAVAESFAAEEAPEPSPRPKAKKTPTQGANRYQSKVKQDYALYGQADADTVQDSEPQARRPTDEIRTVGTAVRPRRVRRSTEAKKGGAGGKIFGLLVLLVLVGLGVSAKVGPLQPVVGPQFDRLKGWASTQVESEPPPPPPQSLKRSVLPPQAVSLMEKERLQHEDDRRLAAEAALAAARPPAPPPAPPTPDPVPPPSPTGKKAPTVAKGAASVSHGSAARPGTPEGEAEILDTRSRAGASRDGVGWLSLFSVPPAQVYDGDTNLGVSPLVKVPLPAGTYRLRLVDPDGKNRRLSAPVKKGEVTTLTIKVSDLPVEE